jgi:hypothetical protein
MPIEVNGQFETDDVLIRAGIDPEAISSWSRSHERKTRRSVPEADRTNGQVPRSVLDPDRTDGHELCDSNSVSSCHFV